MIEFSVQHTYAVILKHLNVKMLNEKKMNIPISAIVLFGLTVLKPETL
jgi:hypothetical protein